ncbi:MAG TPA: type II toxin-antitoxin system PemK/MazF family toxin [Candidatus Paceibacterota bacterium]
MGRINYIPERGDIVKLDLSPTKGHEQSGYRPFVILSRSIFNLKGGHAVGCPITSRIRHDPFEVLMNTEIIKGAILTDQIRAVDYVSRRTKLVGKCPTEVLDEVTAKLSVLIQGKQ